MQTLQPSAAALLLNAGKDYEKIHQIVLGILLSRPFFLEALLGISYQSPDVKIEYENQDIVILMGDRRAFIELKMWGSLYA